LFFIKFWFPARFKETDGFFDWYVEWPELKNDVKKFLPPRNSQVDGQVDGEAGGEAKEVPKILMIGCGNSKLSEQMYNDGYTSMVNVDISDVVIDKMREKYKESHPEMVWRVADARNLEDASGTYDCAFDKGTVDALMSNAEQCGRKNLTKFDFSSCCSSLKF
jgi:2-polyprenyl-3-methyl-5-hydroxy-6-metoxy-1,4-benzoquinol methylase